jgi:hypothetical protein
LCIRLSTFAFDSPSTVDRAHRPSRREPRGAAVLGQSALRSEMGGTPPGVGRRRPSRRRRAAPPPRRACARGARTPAQ